MPETLLTTDGVEVKAGDRVWLNELPGPKEYIVDLDDVAYGLSPVFKSRRAAIEYRIARLREELSRLETMLSTSDAGNAV